MKQSILRKRRAISSIIGTFFFIVIMVAAFGAILTAISFQTQLVEQQARISDVNLRKIQEDFTQTPFCVSGVPDDYLGVNIENVGTNEVQIATIWYNLIDDPFTATFEDVSFENRYVPPGSKLNVLDATSIVPADGRYLIKVVTTLGNMIEKEFTYPCIVGDPTLVLEDDLVAKPAVYAAFPNPWVEGSGITGYYGVIVVNPTQHPMTIYRTSLQVLTTVNPAQFPTSPSLPDDPGQASMWPVTPGEFAGGQWGGNKDSIFWEEIIDPDDPSPTVVIAPYSASEFITSIDSGGIAETRINTVNTNTLTSFGQFGSLKIDTLAATELNVAVPNIFLTDDEFDTTPSYLILNAGNGNQTPQNIYVAMENTSKFGTIDAGSRLVINVPSAFVITDNSLLLDGFTLTPGFPRTFDDNSNQLSYTVSAPGIDQDPGVSDDNMARVGFTVTPPALENTSVYIFYMYGYGTTTEDGGSPEQTIIGPVAEVAVQVCKTGGC